MTLPSALARRLLLAGAVLAGCAERDQTNGEFADTAGGEASGFLRLDVFPSNLDGDLLPQTLVLEDRWEGLDVQLDTPVLLEGMVTGFDATPHVAATVPGSDVPVQALLSAWVPRTVMNAGTMSGSDGSYALRLAPSASYYLSVIPVEPTGLPFVVAYPVDIGAGEGGGAIYLDYGVPVHGRVTTQGGVPLAGIQVQAVDAATGVGGPVLATDSGGWYDLRLLPGEYDVRVSGREGLYVPTCTGQVYAEERLGAQQDFVFGALDPITVEGDVRSGDARIGVDGIEVRFTATTLDDHPSCSLEVATNTDQYGQFSARVLPGRYLVEVVPPYNTALSPLQTVAEFGDTDVADLGTIDLERFVPLSSIVVEPGTNGAPVEGVQVHVEVVGFDGYTYDTFTNEVGIFELEVPHTKLSVRLTPAAEAFAVRRLDVPVDEFPDQVVLGRGRRISGTVTHEGQAVAYAPIEVRDSDGALYATTTTDGSGDFSVRVEQE